MCTLTFIARGDDYYLAMNRDESISRGVAAPPARIDASSGKAAIYPRDSVGGTWIGTNNRGMSFALLNWSDVLQASTTKERSRGVVIPHLLQFGSHGEVQTAGERLNLKGILPFRLVGIFPAEKRISEWRWNADNLETQDHAWKSRHWFSSGLSDEQAAKIRGEECQSAWHAEDAGSLQWLRRLHASHVNGPGPFSLCVHREGVKTLSYTELACTREWIDCRYFSGSPCAMVELEGLVRMERLPVLSSPSE